ncbi:transposase [Lysobacter koreensis]|uniref:Transposase n=1 Tax=Lysobacter koreensis TaxID=266122 RepID=A0ABW2YKE5_9GAMM
MTNPTLRRGRMSEIGAYYAVTMVTHRHKPYLGNVDQARPVIAELAACKGAESLAWVVMPDHVHWLFQLRLGTLSGCVQAMKSRSSRTIRASAGSCEPLWQAGFYDHRLRNDDDLPAQARYIVANPLRRGLVQRIDEYPFWWCRWIRREADL